MSDYRTAIKNVKELEAPSTRPPQSEVEAAINVLMNQISSLRVSIDSLEVRLRPVMFLRDTMSSEPDAAGHQSSNADLCIIAQMVETQSYSINAAIEQVRHIMDDLRI